MSIEKKINIVVLRNEPAPIAHQRDDSRSFDDDKIENTVSILSPQFIEQGIPTFRVVFISGKRVFRTYCEKISPDEITLAAKPPRDYQWPNLKVVFQTLDRKRISEFEVIIPHPDNQGLLRFSQLSEEDARELNFWVSLYTNAVSAKRI